MARKIAHYRILSTLGTGGMGTVYRAEDKRNGSIVAVKVLHPHLARDMADITRFRKEAQIAQRLESRHIVKTLDFGHDGDSHYLVMEYVEGRTLGQILHDRRGPLPVEQAVSISAQILTALDVAHRQGVIHRDISPHNVIIAKSGLTKVADFGVAKLAGATMTKTATLIGKPEYMSPDQLSGKAIDTRTDIYSLGIVLYEMLSGAVPFSSESPLAILDMHRKLTPPPLAQVAPKTPEWLRKVVERCLEKDPAARYQSAGEALAGYPVPAIEALGAWRDEVGNGGGRRQPMDGWRWSDGWPVRLAFGLGGGGVAVIVAVFIVAVLSAGGDNDSDEVTGLPTGTATEAVTEKDAPVAGGEVTVHTAEPVSLDPHFSDFSVDITIMQMYNRGLYDLLPGGVLRPAYASELPTVSDDGLTYTIPIKDGMTWADGETLDANDFVFGIQRTCDPTVAGHYQYVLTNIAGCDDYYGGDGAIGDVTVSAPDDLTLEITIATPQATFKSILALWMVYPAPESLGSVDADWPDPPNTPCSGPFCVTEWVARDHLTLVKNESYGLTPKAQLDKITLRIIDDFSNGLQAYEAGEVDMIRLGTVDLPRVRARDDYVSQALPITIGLQFMMEDDLLSDENVRLALTRAIDRDLMNEVVFSSAHIPTTNWVPAEEPGANAPDAFEDVIGYDEEGARQALADAGYPDGAGFPGVTIIMRDDDTEKTLGAFLQEQFLTILGIDLTVEVLDSQTGQEEFNSSDFQLRIGGWGHDYPDAENWLVGLYETGASMNKQLCSDPNIDAAIAQAKLETEDALRWALLREAERLVVEGTCGIAPLYHRGNHYMISPDLGGVEPTLEDHFMPQFPENWFLAQ